MALSLLSLGAYLIIILSVISAILLLIKNGKYADKLLIYFPILIYSFLTSFINYTSEPNNYTSLRIIALIWPFASIISLCTKFSKKDYFDISRFLLFFSLLGTTIQLIFFI